MPLYQVVLDAEFDVTATSDSEAIKFGEDDAREFLGNWEFDVNGVELAEDGMEETTDIDEIKLDGVNIESQDGVDYTLIASFILYVSADTPAAAAEQAKKLPHDLEYPNMDAAAPVAVASI